MAAPAAPAAPAAGGPGLLGRLFGRSGETARPVPAPTPEVAPPAPVSSDTSELDIAADLLRHLLSHLPEAHDDLVPLLQRKIEAAEAREELERLADQVAGLLAGDGGGSERAAADQVLLQLVERLELSAESAALTAALKNRLQQGLSESDLPAVLEQLVELVSQVRRAAEQDRQEVERFLLELTEQLGQIDQELDGVGAQGQAMIDQNRQFGERVNNDMSGHWS